MLDIINQLFVKPIIRNVFGSITKKAKDSSNGKLPKLSFQKFSILNFKGIESVEIDLAKNSLVLLLGLNESGKTTILKAVEAFSFLNDPDQEYNPKFFTTIRKKSAVGSSESAKITATIKIDDKLSEIKLKSLGDKELSPNDIENINSFIYDINEKGAVTISRVFPFKNGVAKRYFYQFESDHPFAENKLSSYLAHEIVSICPYIIYFEDFKDRIPEKIYVNKKRESFDPVWYDIIDGLFYNTDPNFSIENVKKFHSPKNPMLDDAATVETRVNKTLNKTFTEKWTDLSGVKEIDTSELKYYYNQSTQYFTLKVKDKDGTTYSADERSKGALWYLSFLMKTEFRSKKMRKNSGKPVFLIDEPASNLHSSAQQNMINDFKTLAKDTSIIYTTHSQYLISTENIRNTYVIEKKNGSVLAQKWGQYLNGQDSQISYYQPLANLLNIIPNSFEVPWNKCILTEGPSDRHVIISMARLLSIENLPVIYPGTSASQLSALVALNIGWNSKFRILLDGDDAGYTAADKLKENLLLDDEIVHLPGDKKMIEKCFSKKEMENIRDIVLPENKSSELKKKEFASVWALVAENDDYDEEISKVLTKKTLDFFLKLISSLMEY
ncbi:MAG: ATP-dependent endonuclease [Ekhidna sp.]